MTESDITWKSQLLNLPRGITKFFLNAIADTLPTNSNLRRWKIKTSDKCSLCGNKETLHHILNHCKTMLDQGRYTWRHDSILSFNTKTFRETINKPDYHITADLPGEHCGASTIPADILVTKQKPDIVIINRQQKSITLFELSVPFETNIDTTHQRKVDRYTLLTTDLEQTGYKVNHIDFEVGSRGLITPTNKARLQQLLTTSSFRPPQAFIRRTTKDISSLAIISSFIIFYAKYEQSWCSPPLTKI
jgi:hypothetical protein